MVGVGSTSASYPIFFEAEDEGGGRGLVGDDIGAALYRGILG